MRLTLLVACCLFFTSCTDSEFSVLDQEVRRVKEQINMQAGTAVVVVRDGQLVHQGFYGFEDIATGKPVDENTRFYIASTAKAFLALAILLAEERGDISRDTSLQALFPQLEFERINADSISVRHLLTHTSGIDNVHLTRAMSYTGIHDKTLRHDMIAASYPSSRASLGEFEYSNIGYNILAVWLDDFYGQDWRSTLAETVLAPLEMEHSSAFISEAQELSWPIPESYSHLLDEGQTPIYLTKTDATMYSVGLLSTTGDMANFLNAQLDAGVLNGKEVISSEIINLQHSRQVEVDGGYFDGYAYGWMTGERQGRQVLLHTGGFPGASVLISFMPEERTGVMVLHNESGTRANSLNSMIEEAVYAQLSGASDEDIRNGISQRLSRLESRLIEIEESSATDEQGMSAGINYSGYMGSYAHPLSGSIEISRLADGGANAEWGLLNAPLVPDMEENVFNVSFFPGETWQLEFEFEGDRVSSIKIDDVVFLKQGNPVIN